MLRKTSVRNNQISVVGLGAPRPLQH